MDYAFNPENSTVYLIRYTQDREPNGTTITIDQFYELFGLAELKLLSDELDGLMQSSLAKQSVDLDSIIQYKKNKDMLDEKVRYYEYVESVGNPTHAYAEYHSRITARPAPPQQL